MINLNYYDDYSESSILILNYLVDEIRRGESREVSSAQLDTEIEHLIKEYIVSLVLILLYFRITDSKNKFWFSELDDTLELEVFMKNYRIKGLIHSEDPVYHYGRKNLFVYCWEILKTIYSPTYSHTLANEIKTKIKRANLKDLKKNN